MRVLIAALLGLLLAAAAPGQTLVSGQPLTEGDVVARNVAFGSGERLPELRLHYATLGTPRRDAAGTIVNAVMVLHGTGGSGRQFLQPQFAGELFGPGQPLDIARWYIILPDGIGHGRSSKPSDGLHARFPQYDYADMVAGQHRVLEALGVTQLRLLIGTSMGCMQAFVWGETYPGFAHALLPLACQATEIGGRNRMWRKLSVDAIRSDPAYVGGEYKTQPVAGLRAAVSLSAIAGSAPVALQAEYPTRTAAEAYIAPRIDRDLAARDANDMIWQLEASRGYDPSARLNTITVPVTWINSADDFINPPGLHLPEALVGHMPAARFVLIPESTMTHGHGTHTWAAIWKDQLVALLARSQ